MGRPYLALAVGCTGKALFGVSGRLHWAMRLGLGLGTVSTLTQTTPRCLWIHGLHYKCLIQVKTSKVN